MSQTTLPKGWKLVEISDNCEVISGATPKRNVSEYWGKDVPWVTPKDISSLENSTLEDAPEYISNAGYKSCSTTLLPKGTILFSSRAPIGLVAIAGREMCTNQGFKSLVPDHNVNSNYLYHCMKWMAPKIANMGNGATFKEVSKEVISRVLIPIPEEIEEQNRIAAILDKADAIRRKRKEALSLADQFLRSVFLDMFGDPVTNPKGWENDNVGNICNIIVPTRDKPKSFTGEIPWVTLPDIKDYFVDNSRFKLTKDEAAQVKNRIMPSGTVLMSCAGSLGVITIAQKAVYANQQFYGLVPKTRKNINSVFLAFYLKFLPINFYKKLAGTVTISFFSKAKAAGIKVMLPPEELQTKFETIVFKINESAQNQSFSSTETENLFNSLTQRAFRGEL